MKWKAKWGLLSWNLDKNDKFGRQRSNIYKWRLFEEIRKSETEIIFFNGLRECSRNKTGPKSID